VEQTRESMDKNRIRGRQCLGDWNNRRYNLLESYTREEQIEGDVKDRGELEIIWSPTRQNVPCLFPFAIPCAYAVGHAPRFFQTPPRGRRPCASLTLHLHQVGEGTFTPKLSTMLGTQTKAAADSTGRRFAFWRGNKRLNLPPVSAVGPRRTNARRSFHGCHYWRNPGSNRPRTRRESCRHSNRDSRHNRLRGVTIGRLIFNGGREEPDPPYPR